MTTTVAKPKTVRAIFIMMAIKIVLTVGFYIAFKYMGVSIGGLGSDLILYTLIAYVVLFGAMVFSILKRNIWALRISILLDFAASIPAGAFIGIAMGIAAMILTYRPSAKEYFAA